MTVVHNLVDKSYYIGFVTLMTGGLCLAWGIRDTWLLRRNWKRGAQARDEIFGSIIGLVIVTVGFVGIFKYHVGF